jgi:Cdc6-like AAA superfamily ATPase
MKKVIVLKGIRNVGKSQTIKKVYKLLLKSYPSAKIQEKFIGVDIRVVLTINGTKIGIESQGDPGINGRLKKSLDYFVELNCQIIICATRTYGQTVDAVNKLKDSYGITWIDQTVERRPFEQGNSNVLVAKNIVEEVEKAIHS